MSNVKRGKTGISLLLATGMLTGVLLPGMRVSATELNNDNYRFVDPALNVTTETTTTTNNDSSSDSGNSGNSSNNNSQESSSSGNSSEGSSTENGTNSNSNGTSNSTTTNGTTNGTTTNGTTTNGTTTNGTTTNSTTTNGTTTNGTTTNGTTTNGTTTNGTTTNGTTTNGTTTNGTTTNGTYGTDANGNLVYYDDPSKYLTQAEEKAIANSGGKDTSYSNEGTTVLTGTDASYMFVGDSRTVGMNIYVEPNKYIWSAKSGAGLTWMKKTGIPAIEKDIEDGSSIVIMMGVNDVFHQSMTEEYADYLNEKAEKWVKKGANVYFVSVNPITTDSVAGGEITNAKIEKWNEGLKKLLSDDVTYIDTYSKLKGKLHAGDGLHYYADDCQLLYDTILKQIEEGDVVIEDESKPLEKFKPEITSAERDNKAGEISIVVSKPEDIKNVYYNVQFFSTKKNEWLDAGVTKKTKITLETATDNDVELRVCAYKTYDGEKVNSEWSNAVTVESDGTIEEKEDNKNLWQRLGGWFSGLFSKG